MVTAAEVLASSSLENETFSGLDLSHANLSDKEFYRCTFHNSKMPESTWKRAILESCVFDECDLSAMKVAQMSLRGVVFRSSKMIGIDWSDVATNPEFAPESCDMRYNAFVKTNLRKMVFRKVQLREASFLRCDLVSSEFDSTDLTGAIFDDCDLSKADLSTSTGALLHPTKNRVKAARIPVESAALLAKFFGLRVDGF